MKLSILIAILLTLLAIFGTAGPASAHARLDRANPAPGATVSWSPVEVRIWTTQELTLSGNSLSVTDADGNRVDNDDAHVDQSDPNRKQLVVGLASLASGTYTVAFTTSSADDGAEFSDSFWFAVELSQEPSSVSLNGDGNGSGN